MTGLGVVEVVVVEVVVVRSVVVVVVELEVDDEGDLLNE